MGVAQVVEAHGWHAGVAHDPLERFVDGVGVDRVAFAVGEHPAFVIRDAHCCEAGGLEGTPAFEYGDGGGVELDGAPGGLGLAAGLGGPRSRRRRGHG